jgi:hypothetical protein
MTKIMDLLLRLWALPFVFCIIVIKYNYHAIRNACLFLRYGGEWITYAKGDRNTILDIYKELKDNRKI